MSLRLSSPNDSPRPRGGFALLITIVLVSFLVLLLVGLASLTRVETQIAGNAQKLEQARTNALMALNVALGQLQKYAGPDQRATARADILPTTRPAEPTPWSGTSVTGLGGNVYHNNGLLTGVWGNSADSTASAANSAYVNTPRLLTWLVSGNEAAAFSASTSTTPSADNFVTNFGRIISPVTYAVTDNTAGIVASSADAAYVPTAINPAVQMVGPGTVGSSVAQRSQMVAAITQPIQVPASQIPGLGSGTTPTTIGRYAYWVGDEGVKAKFNVKDAWGSSDPLTAEGRYRYQVAQRAGIESVSDGLSTTNPTPIGSTLYDQSSDAGRDKIAKAISPKSVGIALNSAAIMQNRFHDLTTYSQGVLSNTLHGGLKKDLTAALVTGAVLPGEMTSTTNNKNKLWHIPQAALGSSYGSNMASSSTIKTYDGRGPDWQVLRSYAQIPNIATGVSGAGTTVSMDPIAPAATMSGKPTEQTQMGVNPVIVGFQLATQCRLVQAGANSYLEVKHMPAIMLWNPYNVALNPTTLTCELDYRTNRGEYIPVTYYARIVEVPTTGAGSVTTNSEVGTATGTAAYTAPDGSKLDVISPLFNNPTKVAAGASASVNPLQVTINTGTLLPGMAYIYTMSADSIVTAPSASATAPIPTLSQGWNVTGTVPYGICFRSNIFTIPTATAGNTILFNAFSGGPNSTHPTSGGFLAPAGNVSDTQMSLIARNGSNAFQLMLGNGLNNGFQYYFTMAQATSRNAVNFHRSQLKANANGAAAIDGKVPWLAAFNPRATNSFPTAWEYQKANASNYTLTGYYSVNTGSSSNPSLYKEFGMTMNNSNNGAYAAGVLTVTPLNINTSTGVYTIDQTNGPVVLFDIPRKNQPILSIATLQHADTYRASFDTTLQFPLRFGNNAGPAYVIGNSKADQRVGISLPYGFYVMAGASKGNYITHINDNSVKPVYYDHSYLANRALWDGYYFSTVPLATPATGEFPLPNGRHVLAGQALATDTSTLRDYNKAATRLVVDGAFNINSTSVEAWKAMLASTLNAPVGSQTQTDQAPVPRLGYPYSDTTIATSPTEASANTYSGYRALTSSEISSLATEIVKQVKARGPFVSLADFVNRALVDGTANAGTNNDLRLGGALHSALAATTINGTFSTNPIPAPDPTSTTAAIYPIVKDFTDLGAAAVGGKAAGDGTSPAQATPGWVTQADLLQVLGPVISARSDTFVIRVYGEVVDPLGTAGTAGYVQSKAWAEAVVQRLPEYLDQTDSVAPKDPVTNLIDNSAAPTAVNTTNQTFGRRLKVVSFRWLSPSDI